MTAAWYIEWKKKKKLQNKLIALAIHDIILFLSPSPRRQAGQPATQYANDPLEN